MEMQARTETTGKGCCKETSHLINGKKNHHEGDQTSALTVPDAVGAQKLLRWASSSAINPHSWLCLHQSTYRNLSHPHPSMHPFTGIYIRCRQPQPLPPYKSLLAWSGNQLLLVLLL